MKRITLKKMYHRFIVKFGCSYHVFETLGEAWRFIFDMRTIDARIRGMRRA